MSEEKKESSLPRGVRELAALKETSKALNEAREAADKLASVNFDEVFKWDKAHENLNKLIGAVSSFSGVAVAAAGSMETVFGKAAKAAAADVASTTHAASSAASAAFTASAAKTAEAVNATVASTTHTASAAATAAFNATANTAKTVTSTISSSTQAASAAASAAFNSVAANAANTVNATVASTSYASAAVAKAAESSVAKAAGASSKAGGIFASLKAVPILSFVATAASGITSQLEAQEEFFQMREAQHEEEIEVGETSVVAGELELSLRNRIRSLVETGELGLEKAKEYRKRLDDVKAEVARGTLTEDARRGVAARINIEIVADADQKAKAEAAAEAQRKAEEDLRNERTRVAVTTNAARYALEEAQARQSYERQEITFQQFYDRRRDLILKHANDRIAAAEIDIEDINPQKKAEAEGARQRAIFERDQELLKLQQEMDQASQKRTQENAAVLVSQAKQIAQSEIAVSRSTYLADLDALKREREDVSNSYALTAEQKRQETLRLANKELDLITLRLIELTHAPGSSVESPVKGQYDAEIDGLQKPLADKDSEVRKLRAAPDPESFFQQFDAKMTDEVASN